MLKDYDKEPLIIKNSYLFKKELVAAELLLLIPAIVIWVVYSYFPKVVAENDGLDLLYCKAAILLSVLAIFFVCYNIFKAIKQNKQTGLFIKIFNNKIAYDYLTEKGEFKTFILPKENIKSVKWGFYPYATLNEKDEVWVTETSNDRFGAYLFLPLNFILSCVYQLLYYITNLKFEKYALVRFRGGIMAIPKKEYPSNEKIPFEWRSLFNHHILQGAHYGK